MVTKSPYETVLNLSVDVQNFLNLVGERNTAQILYTNDNCSILWDFPTNPTGIS